MDDRDLISLFFRRDESAIQKTSEKYGHYCFTVAWNILFDREDSEECVNDTWLKTWDLIPPEKPKKLQFFLAKITRNFALNRLRTNTRQKRGGGEYETALEELEYTLHTGSDPAQDLNAKELASAVNRFVKNLPEKERNVFIRRYFYLETPKQIAERYSMGTNNVSVMLNRTRTKLKEALEKGGYL